MVYYPMVCGAAALSDCQFFPALRSPFLWIPVGRTLLSWYKNPTAFVKNRDKQRLPHPLISDKNPYPQVINMMLATQLKLLKEKRKLTTQQLSDLSGVPVGTINRILSGQTDNPSFQTVCDLVMAMDGSPGRAGGHPGRDPSRRKKRPRPVRRSSRLYEEMIATKNAWLLRLFVCLCVVTFAFLFVVIFDLMNPSIGFFRG